MQSDRELMQQALEALEYVHEGANNQGPHTGISWRCASNKVEPAITALRERLAQPYCDDCGGTDPECPLAQPEQSPLDRMAENARELGLDYEPTGIAVSKVWWDGETLRAEAIPVEQVYKQPVQEPECCPDTAKCLSAGVCIAKHGQEPVAWLYRDSWGAMKLSQVMPPPVGAFPVYTAPPQPDTKVNSEAIPKQISAPVAHSIVAGALFDFMGWLTTRRERLVLSSSDDAAPAADAIRDFAQMRSLSINDAQVQEWQKHLTTPPRREWQGLTDDELEMLELKHAPPVHPDVKEDGWWEFARAIEAKLRGKNSAD